jgi:hypothetical protein
MYNAKAWISEELDELNHYNTCDPEPCTNEDTAREGDRLSCYSGSLTVVRGDDGSITFFTEVWNTDKFLNILF